MDGSELTCTNGPIGATLSGSLMHRVLSQAYVWVPIMAPDTFSCQICSPIARSCASHRVMGCPSSWCNGTGVWCEITGA